MFGMKQFENYKTYFVLFSEIRQTEEGWPSQEQARNSR